MVHCPTVHHPLGALLIWCTTCVAQVLSGKYENHKQRYFYAYGIMSMMVNRSAAHVKWAEHREKEAARAKKQKKVRQLL